MRSHQFIFYTLSLLVTEVYSDLLGPRFSAPVKFSGDDSLISASWKNITSLFDTYLGGNHDVAPKSLNGLVNLTFSAGLFSIHDPSAKSLQYHYTSDEVKNGPGLHKVDGDSIYRVASVSKLFTVFAGQLSFSKEQWNQPITDFVPGLSQSSLGKFGNDIIRHIKWEEVTLRALAAQIAGVPREAQPVLQDIVVLPDLITGLSPANTTSLGLPPVDLTDSAAAVPCFQDPELLFKDPLAACPADLFFDGIVGRPPTFEPWSSPAYANAGFILLGIALANVTDKPLAQVYHDAFFTPLRMTNSKSVAPPETEWSQYVIPGNDTTVFAAQGGLSISSGGLFSTLNDLTKFGIALLNSTLLPGATTREWLKPVSHSASLTESIGAPWEIYRYTHAKTGAVTDIYTKEGDSGDFTSYVVLLPDYDAGFNILSAGKNATQKSNVAATIADIISSELIPALEAQAIVEATHNFAGTYKSNDPTLNSSLTLTLDETTTDPGLYISSWTSNGTDVVAVLPYLLGPKIKLQPSIKQLGQVAFRAIPEKPVVPPGTFIGPFMEAITMNRDWLVLDALTYGGIGVSLFVFDVGEDGKATAVTAAAWRAKLDRVA
jgi:CubicO group peptidase (beta-lactamase class C family)